MISQEDHQAPPNFFLLSPCDPDAQGRVWATLLETVFGDGVYSHSYPDTGIYELRATVHDEDGNWTTEYTVLVGDNNYTLPSTNVQNAVANAPAAGDPPNLGNYRRKFIEATPDMNAATTWEIHHSIQAGRQTIDGKDVDVLGQRFLNRNPPINVHDPVNMRGVDPRVHHQITGEQKLWLKNKMRQNNWLNMMEAYEKVDLEEYLKFANKLDDDFKDYFVKAGPNQMKRIKSIANKVSRQGGLLQLTLGKANRLRRYGLIVGAALPIFTLFSSNAKAAANIAYHGPEQLAAYYAFVEMYNNAIDEVQRTNKLSHNTAILLRDAALNYAKALELDEDAIAKMSAAIGAFIDLHHE